MKKILTFTSVLLISSLACTSDTLEPQEKCPHTPHYSDQIKDIIDLTCAYSGCHNGTPGTPGDFTTYQGMLRYLRDGSFYDRVIDQKDNPARGMPPDQSVYPESLQDDLSELQLETVMCWLQNNYPE